MSKGKNLTINVLQSPKSGGNFNFASPRSIKSTKSVVQNPTFRDIGLEVLITQLNELKIDKQRVLDSRKKQQKALVDQLMATLNSSSFRFNEIHTSYKEQKHKIKALQSEQSLILANKLESAESLRSELKFRLKVLEINETIKNIAETGIELEISKEIALEISKIQLMFIRVNKLNQQISEVLSFEELAPFYDNIKVSLCKEITKTRQKRFQIKANIDKIRFYRQQLEEQVKIQSKHN